MIILLNKMVIITMESGEYIVRAQGSVTGQLSRLIRAPVKWAGQPNRVESPPHDDRFSSAPSTSGFSGWKGTPRPNSRRNGVPCNSLRKGAGVRFLVGGGRKAHEIAWGTQSWEKAATAGVWKVGKPKMISATGLHYEPESDSSHQRTRTCHIDNFFKKF